jgi:hypothetical protein
MAMGRRVGRVGCQGRPLLLLLLLLPLVGRA